MGDLVTQSFRIYSFDGGTSTNNSVGNEGVTSEVLSEIAPNIDNVLNTNEVLDNDLAAFTDYQFIGYFTDAEGHNFYLFQEVSFPATYVLYSPTSLGTPGIDTPTTTATDFPASFPASTLLGGPTAICFAHGTRIAGPETETTVEDLRIGDLIETACGNVIEVIWIGRQTVHKLFSGPNTQPVRIRAGALGDGLPHTDLTVTADHGMVIDGYVINAAALVNGETISFVPMNELEDSFTVYHVETENHDVILANGAPSETFLDAVTRSHFYNYQEYLDLYGAERIIPEMDRPRISSQRLVPRHIKQRLGIEADAIDFGFELTA